MPYTVNKATLVERIADVALSRKLPPLVDVKDLSTDDVRIALELKNDADEKMVMAYLFKHTPLQTSFIVNLTCLIPTENPEVGRPERLDLHAILWHFLHFRLEVVTRRLEHELEALKKRVHILEGFEKVFDALDEILKIVRKSDGKADAAQQIIKRFALDAEQTDAILELKIYRLARLEILVIQKELEEKRAPRCGRSTRCCSDEGARWEIVRVEIEEIQKKYGDRAAHVDLERGRRGRVLRRGLHHRGRQRRHRLARRLGEAAEGSEGRRLDARARRRRRAGGAGGQHARDGRVLHQLRRRLHVAHHRRPGVDRLRRADPAPLQVEGRRADRGGLQPRSARRRRTSRRRRKGTCRRCTRVAVTSDGYSLRFSFEPFVEPSTRAGPALRARGRRRGVRRRGARHRRRDPDRRHARGARDADARSRRSTSCRARAAA